MLRLQSDCGRKTEEKPDGASPSGKTRMRKVLFFLPDDTDALFCRMLQHGADLVFAANHVGSFRYIALEMNGIEHALGGA